jgi:hypothetical protein
MIDSGEDFKEIFTDNLQDMYVQPDNSCDLRGYRQKSGESLRDYIQRFSRKCHELLKIGDTDVMSAFWSDMSCHTLIHELGCDQSKITKELFDIATRHTSGKEAVRAIFLYGDGTTVPGGSRGGTAQIHRQRHQGAKCSKRGRSGVPNGSQLPPVVMTMMTRSMSRPPSVISGARRVYQTCTLRNFSNRHV